MAVGQMTMSDLLQVKYQATSLLEFGLERMGELVIADMTAHNLLVAEMFSDIAGATTERYLPYGGVTLTDKMRMVNEFGRTETRRPPMETGNVGFPLHKFQFSVGWTSAFLEAATVYDIANTTRTIQDAHVRTLTDLLKNALLTPTNDTAYRDLHTDELAYTVRRLLNADSQPIPTSPSGKTFDKTTHTHYIGTASFDNAAFKALHDTVREHEPPGELIMAVNEADEDTVRGFTDFKELTDVRIVSPKLTSDVYDYRFDPIPITNKPIGVFKSARVWIKSWVPSGYAVCWAPFAPNKPVLFRRRTQARLQGLRLVAQMIEYPMYVDFAEDYVGAGVYQREAAAVLDTAHASYTDPAISIYG